MRRSSALPTPPSSHRTPASLSPAQLQRLRKRRMTLPARSYVGEQPQFCIPPGRLNSDSVNGNSVLTPPTNILITFERSTDNEVFNSCDSNGLDCGKNLVRRESDDRTRYLIESLRSKINDLFNQIQVEQSALEENVDGYLAACSTVDKDQLPAIKATFERNNQRFSSTVTRLRRKVISYENRLAMLEQNGVVLHRRRSSRVLKHVGHGIKNIATKPIELAQQLKHKFGSSDSYTQGNDADENEINQEHSSHLETSHLSTSNYISIERNGGCGCSDGGEPSRTSSGGSGESEELSGSPLLQDSLIPLSVDKLRLQLSRLRMVVADLRVQTQSDIKGRRQLLELNQEVLDGLERQVSDASELFQNEIQNIKQEINGLEEKMSYIFEEKITDLHEHIENCITRVAKLEVQHQQHQQLMLGEGAESSRARFIVATINIVLLLLGFIFLSLQTLSTCVNSVVTTRTRSFFMIGVMILALFVCNRFTVIPFQRSQTFSVIT